MTRVFVAERRRADVAGWVESRDGIAHRSVLRDAGFHPEDLRAAVASGAIQMLRRQWFVSAGVRESARIAAAAGGRIGCITAARERGWWLPPAVDDATHIAMRPTGSHPGGDLVVHWNAPIVGVPVAQIRVSVEDALGHIAGCLPFTDALVVWESAVRTERLDPAMLRRLPWASRDSARLAQSITGLADSGLETILIRGLSHLAQSLHPQALVAGHRVDLLIGECVVVQVDGHAFHSSAADRTRDLAHDHELMSRGYTVLRFTYAQIVHDWPAVARVVTRAVALARA